MRWRLFISFRRHSGGRSYTAGGMAIGAVRSVLFSTLSINRASYTYRISTGMSPSHLRYILTRRMRASFVLQKVDLLQPSFQRGAGMTWNSAATMARKRLPRSGVPITSADGRLDPSKNRPILACAWRFFDGGRTGVVVFGDFLLILRLSPSFRGDSGVTRAHFSRRARRGV